MASTGTSAPNLATVLLIKRKIAAKNNPNGDQNDDLPTTINGTGAYSQEKMKYRQDPSMADGIAAKVPGETTEPSRISRKTKQLEITALDKKMEEIDRKQAVKTNETEDTWKGFDSVNYGFAPGSEPRKLNPAPAKPTKQQHTPPRAPSPKAQPAAPVKNPEKPITQPSKQEPTEKQRSPTPKRVKSPDKEQPKPKSPTKEEPRKKSPQQKPVEKSSSPPPEKKTVQKQTSPVPPQEKKPVKKPSSPPPEKKTVQKQTSPVPPQEKKSVEKHPTPPPEKKPVQRQPSPPLRQKSIEKPPPPSPPPRRSKIGSATPLEKIKHNDQVQPKSVPSTPVIENAIPISVSISNPEIVKRDTQPFEPASTISKTNHHFKLFPNIKPREVQVSKNTVKSIQRSMDRYRFNVW